MFDHPIEKDCVSDLSGPGSCRIGPVRQVAGPENAAIQNLAALHLQMRRVPGSPLVNPLTHSFFSILSTRGSFFSILSTRDSFFLILTT